jgi:KDO2-lipid IV(A) lauroyltransferase
VPKKRRKNLRTRLAPRIVKLGRYVPNSLLLAARGPLSLAFRSIPGWRRKVAEGMAAALGPDGFERRHVDEYFRHLADLAAFSAAVLQRGVKGAGLEREWVHDPESERRYLEALELGKGVIMVGPHLVGHEIMVGTAASKGPITVLVRKSPDAEYEAIKQQWYSALGVNVAYRPQKGTHSALGEMTVALRALRKNQILAITPDLTQESGTGVPVRLFNRTIHLPAGAFFLSVVTGAPLMPSFFHREDGRYQLWTHEQIPVAEGLDRDAAVADLAQRWATLFEQFVREHPDMWQFWLDKRWRKTLGL